MNILIARSAAKQLEGLAESDRHNVMTALDALQTQQSLRSALADLSSIRRLNYDSPTAYDVASREYRTPMFSYRVRNMRIVFTPSTNTDANGDTDVVAIVAIIKQK